MTDRALLFDVGNTRIKWGVLEDDELKRTGSVLHSVLREKGIETLTRKLPQHVTSALACNVAGPYVGRRLARAIGIHIDGDLRYVQSQRSGFGIENGYRQPRRLGVDRWVAMVGAWAEFECALCVVDAGTAVTIDAMDEEGLHLGGQIIPGLRMLGDALAADTSDIGMARRKAVTLTEPIDMFARTTATAVAHGSLNAICGAVERALEALSATQLSPVLVLTGGDASRILEGLGSTPELRPHLVLNGLAHMVQCNA